MNQSLSRDQDLKRLGELIAAISYGMLTTINDRGELESRPMETVGLSARQPFDGILWFFTSDDSPKTEQLEKDQHVNVAYCDPARHRFASLQGSATIVRERALFERFWTPAQKVWFPGGLDDPHLSLLRVEIRNARYWDSAGKVREWLKRAAAMVTRNPAAVEDGHKVEVKKSA